jgi:excisionase family DNA binding protein
MPKRRKATEERVGDDVLDFAQAQEFLNTTRTTLYRWIAQKRVRAFKAGRQWRFYRSDLEQFLKQPDPSAVQADERAVEQAINMVRRWRPKGMGAKDAPEAGARSSDGEPIPALAGEIVSAAWRFTASDIHVDPSPQGGTARLRIDGVLRPVVELSKSVYLPLIGRFKVLGGMDVADRASMQSGRIEDPGRSDGDGHLLAQVLPTPLGEKLTLRLISSGAVELSFEQLGLAESDRDRLEAAIRQPCGIVIFGGPTGAGKTTVLYAALRHVVNEGISAISVHSTVDYRLPGVVQLQTNPRGGLTHASLLQGILRSDPDVVAVTDVPDRETARLSVELALTGHMVFLQLYANDAALGIQRPIDLGVEPYLAGSSLVASLNQRLARMVCEKCRAEFEPEPEQLSTWRQRAERGGLEWPEGEATLYRGKGCDNCRGTGYRGRIGLFEVLTVSSDMASLITRGASPGELRDAAVREGMTTLFADGMRKALAGITSPLEVARVTDPAWTSE